MIGHKSGECEDIEVENEDFDVLYPKNEILIHSHHSGCGLGNGSARGKLRRAVFSSGTLRAEENGCWRECALRRAFWGDKRGIPVLGLPIFEKGLSIYISPVWRLSYGSFYSQVSVPGFLPKGAISYESQESASEVREGSLSSLGVAGLVSRSRTQ